MIDKNKIPEYDYNVLVELMGREETEKYIKAKEYNYYDLGIKILRLKTRLFIKKSPKVSIIIGICMLLFFIYFILDMFLVL